ncbi:hypothetical protein EB001_17650 [bacterium]|nr:hypothetical protein [bacterium]
MNKYITLICGIALSLFLTNSAKAACKNSDNSWPHITTNPVVKYTSVTDGSPCKHGVFPDNNLMIESGSIIKKPKNGELIQTNLYTFMYHPKNGFKRKDSLIS